MSTFTQIKPARTLPRTRPVRGRPVTTRATGLWTALLLSIFASRVAWYDLRIVFDSLTSDVFRDILLWYAVALFPFVAVVCLRCAKSFVEYRVLTWFAFLAVYGLLPVAVYGVEAPIYVAQDLYKLTFIPVGFLIVALDPPASCDQMLRRLSGIVFLYIVFKLGVSLLYYHGTFGHYYGGVVDLYPFCYHSAKYCSRGGRHSRLDGQLAAITALLLVLGQKRTVLVIMALVVLYLVVTRWRFVLQKPTLYLSLLTAVCVTGLFWDAILDTASDRFQRLIKLQQMTTYDLDMPRLAEINIVYELLNEKGTAAQLFGLGHGVLFENDAVDTEGKGFTHSVHFTPAAMLLRYGLFGGLFYLMVAKTALFPRPGAYTSWMTASDVDVIRCYGLAAVAGSLAIYGLVDDVIIGAMAGAVVLNRRMAAASRATASR